MLAAPLTKMTEQSQDFVSGTNQEAAWQDLKRRLVTAPVLAYPDLKMPVELALRQC